MSDTTRISGNKDKIGYFFLFLFLFFCFFLYLMCRFQLQLSVWSLLTHSLVLNCRFQPRNKRTKGEKNSVKSNQSPPNTNFLFFFLSKKWKKLKHVKYFSSFTLKCYWCCKISLSQTERKKKKAQQRQHVPKPLLQSVWLSFPKPPLKRALQTH